MKPPQWEIPIDQPPQVVAIGRNAHGFVPSDRYRLDELWSLHLYAYDAVQRLDGQEVTIRPGTLGVTPPGTLMETRYFGISVHIYAHFRLAPGPMRTVAAVTDLGADYQAVYDELYAAVGSFAREPVWASARVWNALWKVVSLSGAVGPGKARHRAVRRVSDLIEQNLDGRLSVVELARQVEVAPSYLTRLFQEEYGESVVGQIRRRRMERASDLLQRSSLPIKIVASAVGFSDLQQFNKAVRSHFGVGPREWRNRGEAR
ncbi:AraC family transcriptional regulator [bacterium]|nr:MAG: AraC family transcriptional regulator [bacterium]